MLLLCHCAQLNGAIVILERQKWHRLRIIANFLRTAHFGAIEALLEALKSGNF